MRNIQIVLERWGNWLKHKIENEVGYARTAVGFKGILPEAGTGLSCSEDDALVIDACVGRLKQKRPDKYEFVVDHYIKTGSWAKAPPF